MNRADARNLRLTYLHYKELLWRFPNIRKKDTSMGHCACCRKDTGCMICRHTPLVYLRKAMDPYKRARPAVIERLLVKQIVFLGKILERNGLETD